MHDVTATTVRQWIRRGKLRTAKKVGRDWLIPSITERPSRGFTNGYYHWLGLPNELKVKFPFLIEYNSIYIPQNEDEKSLFDCYLKGQHSNKQITLSNNEREKLEVALIGCS